VKGFTVKPVTKACTFQVAETELILYVLRDTFHVQPQGTPKGTVSSSCNSDVPSQATYQRFLFVVRAHIMHRRHITAHAGYLANTRFQASAHSKLAEPLPRISSASCSARLPLQLPQYLLYVTLPQMTDVQSACIRCNACCRCAISLQMVSMCCWTINLMQTQAQRPRRRSGSSGGSSC